MTGPLHGKRGCSDCQFLGSTNGLDLYFCTGPALGRIFVFNQHGQVDGRRPSDVATRDPFHIQVALYLAKEQGYVS